MTPPPLSPRALAVIAALPNLLLAAAATPHGTRALVNLEYLLLAPLARVLSRGMLATLLTLCLLLDVVFSFGPVFNFGPGEIVAAVEQVRHFTGRAILFAAGLVRLIAGLAVLVVRLALPRGRDEAGNAAGKRVAVAYGAAVVLLLVVDVLNGTGIIGWRARTLLPFDVSTSVIAGQYARGIARPPESGQPMRAATDGLRASLADTAGFDAPSRIVLVVVEAMGAPRHADPDAMFGPLTTPALRRRYDIRTGTVPYAGATTSGEFRELCGIRMSHAAARHADLPPCLPARLAGLGYDNVAIHAYTGSLFERTDWYPRVGFTRSIFAEQLQRGDSTPGCGLMFHGPCDSALIPLLREELLRDPAARRFVYWLTLSSHFPLDPRAPRNAQACAAIGPAGESADACALWSSVWPVLEGIAGIAADSTVPPAWYIIVGDHGPPRIFAGDGEGSALRDSSRFTDDRRAFSPDEVSYIELRPVRARSR